MGTDITSIIEYTDTSYNPNKDLADQDQYYYGFAEINIGRHYTLFGFLSGVRGNEEPIVPVRGLPENISCLTAERALARLIEPEEVEKLSIFDFSDIYSKRLFKRSDFPENYSFTYFPESKEDGKESLIIMPDTFGHSWLLLPELKEVYARTISESIRYEEDTITSYFFGIDSIIASMEALEKIPGYKTRLVFWFDC
jgi:hypothetical protein